MSPGFTDLLRRWFGGEARPAQTGSPFQSASPQPRTPQGADEPMYERTPRPTVGLQWEQPAERAPAGLLHVDDIGPVRIVTGTKFLIGPGLDLPLDLPRSTSATAVGSEAPRPLAGLALRTSLQGGASWALVPLADEPLFVDGAPLAGPTTIGDGDLLQFDERTSVRVLAPDPASAACVLELAEGREDFGGRRVVLLSQGLQGRLRVGRGPRCHVRIETLEGELEVVLEGDEVVLRSEQGLGRPGADTQKEWRHSFPPGQLQPLEVGPRRGARPPFGVALGPLDPDPLA